MKNEIAEAARKIIEDKVRYLSGIATDYATRYADTDSQEHKESYMRYKFAAEQLEAIRLPVSLKISELEKLINID